MCCAVTIITTALRVQVFRGLLRLESPQGQGGQFGKTFERLDDDVPAACFPVELVTEVAGYCIFTFIAVGSPDAHQLENYHVPFPALSLCLF